MPDPVDRQVDRRLDEEFPDLSEDERAALRRRVLDEYAKLTEHESD